MVHPGNIKRNLIMTSQGQWLTKKGALVRTIINCHSCVFQGTEMCPHGIKKGEQHSNNYCTQWFDVVKGLYDTAGSKPKLFQMAELVKSKLMTDAMFEDWTKTGHVHDKFDKLQRNMITLIDKMRRQDEGLKIQNDINIKVDEFNKIVDIQAKVVEGKDIIKEAEILEEELKEENRNGQDRQSMDRDRSKQSIQLKGKGRTEKKDS